MVSMYQRYGNSKHTHTPVHHTHTHTHTHTAYLRQAREDIKQLSDKCIQSSGKRSR